MEKRLEFSKDHKNINEIVFFLDAFCPKESGFEYGYKTGSNVCYFYRYNQEKGRYDIIHFIMNYGDIDGIEIGKNNFLCWVVFEPVFEIMKKIYEESGIRFTDSLFWGGDTQTVINYPGYDKNTNWLKPNDIEYNILDKQETGQAISDLGLYLAEYFFPFFDLVDCLQKVNNEIINKIPHMELSDYIPGEMHLKKLIIMKLCKNTDYYEYAKWLDGSFQKGIEMNRARYEPEMLIFKNHFNFLESNF